MQYLQCYMLLGSKYVSLYLNCHILYLAFYTVLFSPFNKMVLSPQRDPLTSLKPPQSLVCGLTIFYLFTLLLMLNVHFPSFSNSSGIKTCSNASRSLEHNSRSKITGSETWIMLSDTDKMPTTSLTPNDSM